MDENPPSHPGIPEETYTYQKLGDKTLMIFVLQRIGAPLVLLLVSIGLFAIQGQSFVAQVSANFPEYLNLAGWACFVLFAVFFVLAFFIAWLYYTNYKFALGDNSLKIKRGVFDQEEVAIPYRQMQDVDLERPLVFRFLGVTRISILTAGHEDESDSKSEGILPILDHGLAEWLQAELLKRANVQKVVEEK